MLKILVTGGSGLLGSKIVGAAKDKFNVVPTHNTASLFPNSIKMDITAEGEVSRILSEFKPDAVIHTAAETNVDKCETDKEHAWRVNIEGTKNIAAACNEMGVKLVYVSTDYVFDGEKGLYKEDDEPNPINYYGRTKLEGERFVQENSDNWCIARASVIYGWSRGKENFATWLINNLSKGVQVKALIDQHVSPTLNVNLADMLLEIATKKFTGILHTAGASRASRYDFAVELAKAFRFDLKLVKQSQMNEMSWNARRPKDSSLNVSRCASLLNSKPLEISEALTIMRAQR